MDIRQRLQEAIDYDEEWRDFNPSIEELCRDALAEIERLEKRLHDLGNELTIAMLNKTYQGK